MFAGDTLADDLGVLVNPDVGLGGVNSGGEETSDGLGEHELKKRYLE